jgi:hypothetical protein
MWKFPSVVLNYVSFFEGDITDECCTRPYFFQSVMLFFLNRIGNQIPILRVFSDIPCITVIKYTRITICGRSWKSKLKICAFSSHQKHSGESPRRQVSLVSFQYFMEGD